MKRRKRAVPLILRFAIALTALFLTLSIVCVITVNWLDLKSREGDGAPTLFGWQYVSLQEEFPADKLYAGDLLLAKAGENYEEGTLVLCRSVQGAEITLGGRFMLARVMTFADGKYLVELCGNAEPLTETLSGGEILGEVVYAVGFLGALADFVRRPVGFFSLILGSAGLLLVLILLAALLSYRWHIREVRGEFDSDGMGDVVLRALSETEQADALFQADSAPLEEPVVCKPDELSGLEEPVQKEEPAVSAETVLTAQENSVPDKAAAEPDKTAEPLQEKSSPAEPETSAYRQAEEHPIRFVAVSEPTVKEEPACTAEPAAPSAPAEEPRSGKPAFSDMSADEIIEQFRRELEEARLRPLKPE